MCKEHLEDVRVVCKVWKQMCTSIARMWVWETVLISIDSA